MASSYRGEDVFFIKMVLLFSILAAFFGTTLKMGVNAQQGGNFGDVNISAILNSFQMGYDKRVRPNYGGREVVVGVTMYVLSISSLSEVEMDFTLDMYFRQFWQDPRLSFEKRLGLEKLVVGAEYIKLIWVPDTFFVNEKTAYFHDATTDNQFLRILHTGEILRSIRLTITASCPMDLQYFPMDRQLCYMEIESFGYTMSDIRYKWNDGLNSVQISSDVSLPQFKVLGHRQKTIEASLSTGNYSRLSCEIQFVRSMGYYLIQIYIPSSLIVIISWVSFWLNRGATPARVGLGVTTVLTMTTLMASTNAALPKISYVKSIDVYLGACFFMVFASLLEYASVGYMAKRIQMRKNRFLALQKMAEQKKNEAMNASNAALNDGGPPDHHGIPKQTEIRINMHEPGNKSTAGATTAATAAVRLGGSVTSSKVPLLPTTTTTQSQQLPTVAGSHHHSTTSLHASPPPHLPIPAHHYYAQHLLNQQPNNNSCSNLSRQRLGINNSGGNSIGGGDVVDNNMALMTPTNHQQPMQPAMMQPAMMMQPQQQIQCRKNLQKMMGISPSDIDKYSRIFFPVTFTCFNLMYWIIYLHVSDEVADDLVMLNG